MTFNTFWPPISIDCRGVQSPSGVPAIRLADQIPAASLQLGNTGTFIVWGNFLRIDKLRFQPAYMRVAEARSTIGWHV